MMVLTAPKKRYKVIPPATHHQNVMEIFWFNVVTIAPVCLIPYLIKIYTAQCPKSRANCGASENEEIYTIRGIIRR